MERALFIEATAVRVVAVAVAVWLAWYLPAQMLLYAMIALGQAHFVLAYWYQADAGKWNLRKLSFVIALVGLSLWLLTILPLMVFVFVTGVLFLVHFALDEIYLLGGKVSLYTTLECLPFLFLYSGLLSDTMLGTETFLLSLIASGIALLILCVVSLERKRMPNALSGVYLVWAVMTLGACLVFQSFGSGNSIVWFLTLIGVHYGVWYGAYWFRLRGKSDRQRTYLWRSIGVNIAMLFLIFVWLIQLLPPLALLFAPSLFYVWTVIHILTSVRLADIQALLRFS